MFRGGKMYVENNCFRCSKTVYPTDKIGPLKDFTFFHGGCFRCVECQSKLTLRQDLFLDTHFFWWFSFGGHNWAMSQFS